MATIAAIYIVLIRRLHRRILISLKDVFKRELLPAIEKNLMRVYDTELVSKEPSYDPAKPSRARDVFLQTIRRDLNASLVMSNTKISFSSGNLDAFSVSDRAVFPESLGNSPETLEWLTIYLNGLAGEYAFITKDVFEKLTAAGKVPQQSFDRFSTWGWFGDGFLVPRESYYKRKFNEVIPYTTVRHPFSGARPVKLFERALDGINMKQLIEQAVKTALRG